MFLLKLFCDTQYINKIVIKESYNDYINFKCKFKNKYLNFEGYYHNNYKNLNDEIKYELNNDIIEIKEMEKIVINNILNYSKNYPNDKISKHRFINEYNDFPYRLEKNIEVVLLDLDL